MRVSWPVAVVRHVAGVGCRGSLQPPTTVLGGHHPVSPVLLGDAALAQNFSQGLREEGILAVGFFYPVVPQNRARIRLQASAVHGDAEVDAAVAAFAKAGWRLGAIS